MIIVTGAYGFIGSCTLAMLQESYDWELAGVDDFSKTEKEQNFSLLENVRKVERREFFSWLEGKANSIRAIVHLGARTDTVEMNDSVFKKLNLEFSQRLWSFCSEFKIPLIYASSAATYGAGECGYEDSHEILPELKPLNPYGRSKNDFDIWALKQDVSPPSWYGLKFFNVFGPNEYHKGRMASVIFHFFKQIKQNGYVKLFKSHRHGIKDGEQKRDFIYVKDIMTVIQFLLENHKTVESGIYNLGTGKASTYNQLAKSIFSAMNLSPDIRYIDTPKDIRESYQYYTCAEMQKLRSQGFIADFHSLNDAVHDYVSNYLENNNKAFNG